MGRIWWLIATSPCAYHDKAKIMKARVIKAYGQFSVGHIFTDLPGNVARTLIGRNLIEEVAADEIEVEKQFTSPADRMMRGGVKKQAVRK